MRKGNPYLLMFILFNSFLCNLFAQDPPPNDFNSTSLGGISSSASKLASTPINLYTGFPTISFPIYNYSYHNGLSLNISLDYIGAGGVRVNEIPSSGGLGWWLQAGGVITRTVRGMPDDLPNNGFMYSAAIPADYRPNGSKYYHDSLDAEQDVFQYNVNGMSGKFFIGKNKQIVAVPLSKLKIAYNTTGGNNTPISSFSIITESGIKYIFNDAETQKISNTQFLSGYNNTIYTSAWYLSLIVAPFGTDTIKLAYNTMSESSTVISFPQTVYVKNADNSVYRSFAPTGVQAITTKKIASITFPDKKKVQFLYSRFFTYDGKDSLLDRIKISDSVFRFGYVFSWTSGVRAQLGNIRFYTSTGTDRSYSYAYTAPYFSPFGSSGDTLQNKRDHWGYYNAANNGNNVIPTVSGIYTGANRNPSTIYMGASSLITMYDTSIGINYYNFGPNDIYQYNIVPQTVAVNVMNSTSTSVSLSQVLSNQYTINIAFDNSFSRVGPPPFSGTCALNCSITSTDGLTTYATYSPTLYQLFYVGSGSFIFSVPNGNYKLQTTLPSCTVTAGSLPVDFTWQNQVAAGNATTVGGLRINSILHYDRVLGRLDTVACYSYLTTDGKSSGFLGTVPQYNYPYQETVINGSTVTTNYTAISSDPINNLNYTQGSPVGYSRVIEYKGSPTHNLGKTVYEFTNLQDANTNVVQPLFPYAPVIQPDWAMGLPKRISVYDSLGRLIRVTRDTFTVTTNNYTSSDFTSLKLGKVSATFNGDPNSPSTPYTEYYTGQNYNQQTGRADLTSTLDSLFHPDGSVQITYQTLQYDSNYNVIKITSPYDVTRGLFQEKRFYYPYNYTLSSGAIKKLKDSSVISPVISTETWITGDANPRMVSAQITDYQQLTKGHIKPLIQYSLQSNAPVTQTVIGTFNPSSLIRNATYLVPQQNFVTYDTVGNLLEIKNTNSGQSNSVIMDYFNQFPIAKVSNAAYSDIAYTSFESDGTGNWTIGSGLRNLTAALTGKSCYDISKGSISKSGLNTGITYIISYWASPSNNISVSGGTNQQMLATHIGWNLYTQTVSGVSSVTISGTSGLIDELRLYPKDANISTTTYEPLVGATSICDANNTVTYNIYDNLNRLKVIKDNDLNVLKKYEYDTTSTAITTAANWQYAGSTQCETPINGKVDSLIKDMNPYSDTYNVTAWVFAHNDCTRCTPSCNGEGKKLVNCICEMGTRVNISAVQYKVNGVWIWRCTYYYQWSDCTNSTNYTQDNSTPCTINSPPCNF